MTEIKNYYQVSHGSSDFGGLGGEVSLKYQVYSDDRGSDDALVVAHFDSIPKLGTPYQFGELIRRDYRAKRAKPRFLKPIPPNGAAWEVEVFYDNRTGVSENRPEPTESDPFSLSMNIERVQVVATHDLQGKRITNSSGEPFQQEREMLIPVFSMTRQEYRNPCHNVLRYMERVNARPMWDQPVGQVYMRKISPGTQVSYGDAYPVWTVSYEIAINLEGTGWQWELLDAGRLVLSEKAVPGGSKKVVMQEPILDATGQAVTDPQLLDGHGQLLPAGAEPQYLHYDKLYIADLRELRLPNPFLF